MKDFKTFDEQVSILETRGMVITNREEVMTILARENYYNVINGYKDLFLQAGSENYISGSRFEDVYRLYLFDRDIRNLVFGSLLQLENELRTQIAYVFSKHHTGLGYLRYENFETLSSSNNASTIATQAQKIYSLTSRLQNDIADSIRRKAYIKHYIIDHGGIPLWVLVNALPFGRISKFYELMKQAERIEISQHWNIGERELGSYIALLADFRNLCAHDERVYCHRSKVIADNTIHARLGIPKRADGNYEYGKDDLFALMIVFKLLLSPDSFKMLFNAFVSYLNTICNHLNLQTKIELLKQMGFPSNYIDLLNI